ncbi:MAG TPA: IS110 family transposase [Candidatus Dormibacteraeota bacterium]|nr:IS110 family transposase [Candidatus Dormibacteraeota bacterium]
MTILADRLDYVIGVDTHRDSHTAAVLTATGAVVASLRIDAERAGYCRLVQLVGRAAPGKRVWAVEGTRSYGAGLTGHLLSLGETVGEVDRPKRPARKRGKSDEIDAVRAAREALSMGELASPRGSGRREALRIAASARQEVMGERTRAMNQLRALVVSAPEHIAARFREGSGRSHSIERLTKRCLAMRVAGVDDVEDRIRLDTMKRIAHRIVELEKEAAHYELEMAELIRELAPGLLELPGVGPSTAAMVLTTYSHHGRFRNEAAFASMAGVAPIPASSGQQHRHRLNRGGDRRLNWALDLIIKNRIRYDPETMAYMERNKGGRRTERDLRRILKRYLARSLFRFLEHTEPLDKG